jgi:hypothetical protein
VVTWVTKEPITCPSLSPAEWICPATLWWFTSEGKDALEEAVVSFNRLMTGDPGELLMLGGTIVLCLMSIITPSR